MQNLIQAKVQEIDIKIEWENWAPFFLSSVKKKPFK